MIDPLVFSFAIPMWVIAITFMIIPDEPDLG